MDAALAFQENAGGLAALTSHGPWTSRPGRLSYLAFRTVTREGAWTPRAVQGEIPREIRGTLYRNGPGQKEVFDAAAIGSLIKTKRAPEMVERYLPTISSGMDRIGRLLFLTYQHYDDFKDKYGEQDIADLVENLETVFEQLGDLVCFLQKQTLSGDPSSHGLGLASTPLES